MALIGNYTVLNKLPCRWYGGNSTAHASGVGSAQNVVRSNWGTTGSLRNMSFPVGENALPLVSIPDGYGGEGWLMPITAGRMSTHNLINGNGDVVSANLAGGLNATALLVGTGAISSAVGQLIVSALAALSGSGALSSSMVGALAAAASLEGTSSTTAAIVAIGSLLSELAASGSLTATITATGELEATITVTGSALSTANVGNAVWQQLIASGFTAERILRIIASATAGKSSGGPDTPVFRDLGDTQDQITGAADNNGNRTAASYGP